MSVPRVAWLALGLALGFTCLALGLALGFADLALGLALGFADLALGLALGFAELLLDLVAHGLGVPRAALAADLLPRGARLAQRLEHLRAGVLGRPGGLEGLFLGPLAAREVERPQPGLEQPRGPLQVV